MEGSGRSSVVSNASTQASARSQTSSSHFSGFSRSDGVQSRPPTTTSGGAVDAAVEKTLSVPSQRREDHHSHGKGGYDEGGYKNKPKGNSKTTITPYKGNRGFQGRPVIKASNARRINFAGAKISPANGSFESTQSTGSRPSRNPFMTNSDIRLLLAGDGLGRSLTSQTLGQGRSGQPSRSNSKISLGGPSVSDKARSTLSKSALTHNKHCDACAVEFVRYWLNDKQQQQDKPPTLASAIDLAFKKPSSDVRAFYEPLQLIHGEKGKHQRNQIFAMVATTHKSNDYRLRKEPVSLHTVSLPKKGLIKLTGINYELSNPEYYDNRKQTASRREQDRQALFGSALPPPSSGLYRGLLIRNRTMIKQLKHGERLLAQIQDLEMGCLDGDVLDTLVRGLLQYQMPEVPNLNTTIQGFIGAESPSPRLNRERITSPRLIPGTSRRSRTEQGQTP